MPPITHPHRPADPDRRLKVAHLEDAVPDDVGTVVPQPREDLAHDPEDALLAAVIKGAGPREILGHVRHELAREIARLEFYQLRLVDIPPQIRTELPRLAGRRMRVLRSLATMALRDLDAEEREAPVPPEVMAKLEQMFVAKVVEAARAVASVEDARRFEAAFRARMSG